MKVCSISNGYIPYIRGGGEIYVKDIAERMNSMKKCSFFNISISSSSKKKYSNPDIVNGVRVYRLTPINLFNKYEGYEETLFNEFLWKFFTVIDLVTVIKVHNIIEKEKPDLIHLNAFSFFSPFLLFSIRNKPIIYTLHGRNFQNPKFSIHINKLYNHFQNFLFSNISLVISPSRALLKEFQAEGFCKNVSSKVMPLYSRSGSQTAIKHFKGKFKILFIGTLDENKGVDVLLKGFSNIKNSPLELHIGGKGLLQEYVKKIAKEHENIHYHGYLDSQMKDALMREADVLVVPTKNYDNSPLVIYEAFSYALPIVGSNIGGIPELIKENKAGIIVNPNDAQELMNILIELFEDKQRLTLFSRNSLSAAKKYSFDKHINDLTLAYQQLLQESN